VLSDRRLPLPAKAVTVQWKRLSWDQAIDEIGDKLLDIARKRARIRSIGLVQPSFHQPRLAYLKPASSPPSGDGTISDHQGAHLSLDYGHRGPNTWATVR